MLVIYASWRSVRALLIDGAVRSVQGSAPAAERDALLQEKESLLRAIRDAEMDRDIGKLSDRDFERLNGRLRARARDVLAALEAQIAPHRERARGLIEQAAGIEQAPGAGGDTGGSDA